MSGIHGIGSGSSLHSPRHALASTFLRIPKAASTQNAETGDEAQAGQVKQQGPSHEERTVIAQLQQIDAEVRAHETAHLAAAGAYARGGASFQFEIGPDGQRYAVAGEVPIDLTPGRTPEETIAKMQTIQRSATAPANPSGQDYSVRAAAAAIAQKAYTELALNKQKESDPSHQHDSQFNIKI